MKVESVNIGKKRLVKWRLKTVYTGIFKSPVDFPILLGKENVVDDDVVDRKHHAGIDKACYLFSADAYAYWKNLYPSLDFTYGWFGENLTVSGLRESEIHIGNQYKVGEAIIEISQPREPCFKLGIRFESQKVIKQSINHDQPGPYARVIKGGEVKSGDTLTLIEERPEELTVLEVYQLIYKLNKDKSMIKKAMQSDYLAESAKRAIKKWI